MFARIIQFLPSHSDKGNFAESKDPLSPVVRRNNTCILQIFFPWTFGA